VRRQRGRDDAAAHDFARGGDRVEPARRDLAEDAERAADALQFGEFLADELLDLVALGGADDDAGHLQVAIAQRVHVLLRAFKIPRRRFRGDAEQPVGRAAERGHDDDGPAPVGALRLDGGLPGGTDDADQPFDGGAVRDGRPAELHDDHRRPSAFISSALRIDAPAAPRIVL
jgi:hypothetical protein